MRNILLSVIFLTVSGSVPAAVPANWSNLRISALEAAAPNLMRHYSVPGAAVALVTGRKIEWAKGFGVLLPGGPKATPRTRFQGASLGKAVFAYLFLSIARDKGWTLQEPIGQLAPSLKVRPSLRSATPAQLLSHSAGICANGQPGRVDIVASEVGKWHYSGSGYVLLQRLLESVLRRHISELARLRVWNPLKLHHTGFLPPSSGEMTRGFDRSGSPLKTHRFIRPNVASSLYTNALDYGRFLIHILAPRTSNEAAIVKEMITPVVTVDSDLGLFWGLGLAVEQSANGKRVAFHWGSNPGFKSFALVDPDRQIGIVMLTNGDNGLEMAEQVMRILDPVQHALFRFYMLHPDD